MKFDGKQCKVCPFRKTSPEGWLGSYDAGSVFSSIWNGQPFFCHTRIDYKDPRWLDKAMKPRGGALCVGGLAFANKIHARESEHMPIIIGREKVTLVPGIECMTAQEFMAHHRDSEKARSWREFQERREAGFKVPT